MPALSGIRVLDLSRLLPGPFASLVLADLGATVDKIEDPEQGDYLRYLPPTVGDSNVAFQMLNRGKRSLVLDLKAARGRQTLETMLGHYDVLFEQFRPGVMARLGFAPEELCERFPRLIVCSLTGYGQTGPLAGRSGHDLNYLARSGLLGHQGQGEEAPQVPGFQAADISGGMWSVIGILAAILERQNTGKGRWLDIAMSEGTLGFNLLGLAASMVGEAPQRGGAQLTGGIAPYGVYRSKDDRWLSFAAIEPKFWMRFAQAFGIEASMGDLVPGEHQPALREKVSAAFASKSAEEWTEFARLHDLPLELVLTPQEVPQDAHIQARNILFFRDSKDGPVPQFKTPVSPESARFAPMAPRQGADTRAVLAEAGIAAADIDSLIAEGIARS